MQTTLYREDELEDKDNEQLDTTETEKPVCLLYYIN